jgi:hypothetical protein
MSHQTYERAGTPATYRWQDAANVVLAIWLFISPWVLQFGSGTSTAQPAAGSAAVNVVSNAAWNAWVLAVIVFLFALSAMGRRFVRGQEWVNLILGAWIFAAPWALGFALSLPAAAWDHWIVGALIFLVSASGLSAVISREPMYAAHHEPQRH